MMHFGKDIKKHQPSAFQTAHLILGNLSDAASGMGFMIDSFSYTYSYLT